MIKTAGFTLMELIIVMGLIMILSVVGIGSYTQATVRSRDSQRKNDLNQMVKAVESFYTDVGRYPLSADGEDFLHCYQLLNGVVTNPVCDNDRLYSVLEDVITPYISIPSDPNPANTYVYISDGNTYEFYTALESSIDKDLLVNEDETINQDPWGVSCGSATCNYKVTETGLVKAL